MAYFGHGNECAWKMGTTNFALSPLGTTTYNAAGVMVRTLRTPDGRALGAKTTSTEFYVTDHLGSVIGRFDHNGAWKSGTSYDPYGQERFTSGTKIAPWTFTGQWQQTPTLYKLGARYYDTTTARFTQMDPTGQEPNPYTYAGGNPCNNTDPTGTLTQDQCDYAMIGATTILSGVVGVFTGFLAGPWTGVGVGMGANVVLSLFAKWGCRRLVG